MKAFFKRYGMLLIAAGIVLAIAIYYITFSMLAVNRYIDKFNGEYWSRQSDGDKKETVEMHRVPGYHELLVEKGLLGGLVNMAKNDSIGLFLNMPDSVAQLMIKGVAVRNIPLREMRLSPLIAGADPEALYDFFAQAFRVTDSRATIAKEPVNVVNAPKDSSDVIPTVQPDTSNSEPVFFTLDTDKGLRFYFYETGEEADAHAALQFEWADRWAEAKKTMSAISKFTIPDYLPVIKIGVSREDAKVLYRAFPHNGQIVMTL